MILRTFSEHLCTEDPHVWTRGGRRNDCPGYRWSPVTNYNDVDFILIAVVAIAVVFVADGW